MKSIIALAPKFCAKTVDKMTEGTIDFLEKKYQDTLVKQGKNDLNFELPGISYSFIKTFIYKYFS